jgi:hypothetical protein
VIAHPSHIVERTGSPPTSARSIDTESHAKLMAAVRQYATALAVDNRYRDVAAIQQQLVSLHFNGRQFVAFHGAVVRVAGS